MLDKERNKTDNLGPSQTQNQKEENSQNWYEAKVTDVSFAGFQLWALIGLIVIGILFSILSGGDSRFLWLNVILFVGAGAIGGCLISNKYGKKYGVIFLFIPVLLLAGGILFMPAPKGNYQESETAVYDAMFSIRSALIAYEQKNTEGPATIYALYFGKADDKNYLKLIDQRLALADYFNCSEEKKKSLKGNWYALVFSSSDKIPFAEIKGEFAITSFPEMYGAASRYIYLMNEKGDFYRVDLKQAMYIKQYPGPDPVQVGWELVRSNQ